MCVQYTRGYITIEFSEKRDPKQNLAYIGTTILNFRYVWAAPTSWARIQNCGANICKIWTPLQREFYHNSAFNNTMVNIHSFFVQSRFYVNSGFLW